MRYILLLLILGVIGWIIGFDKIDSCYFSVQNRVIQDLDRFITGVVYWWNYGGRHTLILVFCIITTLLAFKYLCDLIGKAIDKWIK